MVVVVLFLLALGPYAQARASRRTRTSSKEETTQAHDHFAMFHMDQVHTLRRSAAARFMYTLPLTTTNASFAPAARRCPHHAHTRYTPHHPSVRPTPLPTRAHYPPKPRTPHHPRAPAQPPSHYLSFEWYDTRATHTIDGRTRLSLAGVAE